MDAMENQGPCWGLTLTKKGLGSAGCPGLRDEPDGQLRSLPTLFSPVWEDEPLTDPSWSVYSRDAYLECKNASSAVARGVQRSSSPTYCCRRQSLLQSKRKQPFPQKIQRIIHLSRNGTSICKRRSISIRFALNLNNICESTN